MTGKFFQHSIHVKWTLVFLVWIILLSGTFSRYVGSPGVIQGLRLKNLLDLKKSQLAELNNEVQVLRTEVSQLEKNPVAQQREIRRVLGYVGPDELIFDFTSH